MPMPTPRALTADEPVMVTVISRAEDGSAMVEIPLLRAGAISLEKTAGGGKGAIDFTGDQFDEMVSNFAEWPGPVPINVNPHRSFDETAGFAPGFIESLRHDGETLFGKLSLGPMLAFEVIDQKGWRGFSVDAVKNASLPSAKLAGWSIMGGVFTNRPAADVNFKVAASASAADELVTVSLSLRQIDQPREGSQNMSETTVATLRAELDAATTKHTETEASLTTAKEEVASLTAKIAELTGSVDGKDKAIVKLQSQMTSLSGQLAEIRDESTKTEVLGLARLAIEGKGFNPSFFEGMEADPVKWLTESGLTAAGLSNIINQGASDRPADEPTSSAGSGPKKGSDPVATLNAAADKIASEKDISFGDALDHVKREQPEVYAAGTADFK